MRPVRLALCLLLALPLVARTAPPEPREEARRLASILDYVAGDYGEAVAHGAVADAHEFEEQLELLADARRIATGLGEAGAAALVERIDALERRVRALEPAEPFAADARALRREIVAAFGLAQLPPATPSLERGRALYATHCATCHGATGAADTPLAGTLQPRPRNFLDAEVMSALTPARAYGAVTSGVPETAMPAFPALDEQARWDLAFTVLALRFDDASAARGASAARAAGLGLADLADATEVELAARLRALGVADPAEAVAWLRRVGPFVAAPSARRPAH